MRYRRTSRFPGILLAAVLAAAAVCGILYLRNAAETAGLLERYRATAAAYSASAGEYRELLKITYVENITGLPDVPETLTIAEDAEPEDPAAETNRLRRAWEELRYAIRLVRQITEPSAEWVTERLRMVEGITDPSAVTKERDPNGMLGKEGGYTACVYFMVPAAEPETVPGTDAIGKGTDGGGAVEVYRTAADALARCDYLSQFDNTLLYTGSCAVIGTMVVRTSYALTDEEQWLLTDRITRAFTETEFP